MLFEKQQYQQDCVDNILAALDGIDLRAVDTARLADNIRALADKTAQALPMRPVVEQPRLDVLMETGTGKTFAYLQTIFELHRRHGHNKFIIVLPRTAIKQGVIQNIKLTDEYFYNLYHQHINYIDHPQDGLQEVLSNFIEPQAVLSNFINRDDLWVLITTNSAFNSEKNNINKAAESLFRFDSPWQGIASQRPVIIIDEPHLLKGSETSKGLDKLTDCLRIRFGATYPSDEDNALSNVVYALDSISAFNQYLVKQIGVHTLYTNAEESGLHVQHIQPRQKRCEVVYQINRQPYRATLKVGDDLGAATSLKEHQGKSITRINSDKVALSSGEVLPAQSGSYQLSETEITEMICAAIRLHLDKEERLFKQGIKALSLFFIPGINDFRGDDARIKRIFEKQYSVLREQYYKKTDNAAYREYLDRDFADDGTLCVHNGYFADDHRGSKNDKERDAVRTILSDKAQLLSLDEPLRFIFSVWALQEGWDNPNVFTICKLAHTGRESSCRQQVGRGLRIAVNQAGKRLTHKHLGEQESEFYRINALDMVVSQQEQGFIHNIQREVIAASFSVSGDTISHDMLVEKGFSNRDAASILVVLEREQIIVADDRDEDTYSVQSSILAFIQQQRDQFPCFKDEDQFRHAINVFADNASGHIVDKNRTVRMVKVRDDQWKKFRQLWETINRQSALVYREIDEDRLISIIADEFNRRDIAAVAPHTRTERYDAQRNRIRVEERTAGYAQRPAYFARHDLTAFVQKFAQDACLPLGFVVQLFCRLDRTHFENNPSKAQDLLRTLVRDSVHDGILQSVHYQFCETVVSPNALQDKDGSRISELPSSLLGRFHTEDNPQQEFLYDTIIYDSDIEKQSIESDPQAFDDNKITVFAKLPKINIPTPYKTYNPDFAYLITTADDRHLFLVVETKGYAYIEDTRPEERQKIDYARRFFNALQETLADSNIQVCYRERTERQELIDIVRDCLNGK